MAKRRLIDIDTGEIVQARAERFVRLKVEVWRYVIQRDYFTTAEEKALNRLSLYLQWNTNAVCRKDGAAMTVDEMANAAGVDRSHFRKTILSLVKKNAIGIWKNGYGEVYYINPYLYEFGTVEQWLFARFEDEFQAKSKIVECKRFKAGHKSTSLIQIVV